MAIGFYETLCRLCKHRNGLGCAAFPKKIPVEIRLMEVDHREPYPGDNGIRFEPKDDTPRTQKRLAKVQLRKRVTLSDEQREQFLSEHEGEGAECG